MRDRTSEGSRGETTVLFEERTISVREGVRTSHYRTGRTGVVNLVSSGEIRETGDL